MIPLSDVNEKKSGVMSVRGLQIEQLALLLQKCMKAKALAPAKQLHAYLLTTGTDLNAMSLSSKLVGVYASCNQMNYARNVLDRTPKPNVFALNWMVLASAFNGSYEEAIGYFSRMQELGISSNKFTFSMMLKACIGMMDMNTGKQIHGVSYRMLLVNELSVANALVDMYGKCRRLDYAQKVFDVMPDRDVASWTSMICGYCSAGKVDKAIALFDRMKLEGFERNIFTWNALIAAHARNGDKAGAISLFERMRDEGLIPDLPTWNAMISGFVQSNQAEEAMWLFADMITSRIKPNQITVTSLLPGCGLTGDVQRGREVHGLIYRMGLDMNVYVISALIDMYSKCGSVKDALNVFQSPIKNVACWNAMIGCFGKHGMVETAVELFERMNQEGVEPNEVTFVCVLSACSHGGLVEKGMHIFRSMNENCRINVNNEHYACIVDLLCRSGKMDEAYRIVVNEMSTGVTNSILGAFFNGCVIHERRDLAELMTEKIKSLELKKPGGFVALSNIYAAGGEWKGVEDVRNVMREERIHKKPGYSRVEQG